MSNGWIGRKFFGSGSLAASYLFDLYPTVCDLVGAKTPESIDGKSFRSVIEGKVKIARPELMLAYLGKQRAIRDDRWKLIRYPEVNVTQLFDLDSDPDENTNLADEPAQKDRVADRLQRLAKLQKHYGDDRALSVANPKPSTPVTAEQLRLLVKPTDKN